MSDVRENPRRSVKSNQLLSSIDEEVWLMAEQRTQEILCTVQPNVVSEVNRKKIIDYVRRRIVDFHEAEVLQFGSVPLKTYLPDGDIDLTVLSRENSEEDTAQLVCSVLEMIKDPEYPVKDIQLIRAQVKVVKCTVANIAVDISFNQMAGLFALRFLEQVNEIAGKNHLFKHSILLVKAWCYYESRILGAHHGLLSTYAVEILVLYIINRFYTSVRGPLEVLYRFLDYYSKFNWDHDYVSIEGPIALSSLPEIVEIPDSDRGELLLNKEFLKIYRDMHSAYSLANDTANLGFTPKHMNILDPLKHNNNLGRSVSKGNLHRIKFAISYGAKKLKEILRLPGEHMGASLERFFMNTLNRNGKGQRPDINIPVPAFGTERYVEPVLLGDCESFYSGIRHVQSCRNYAVPPGSPTSPFQADILALQAQQTWCMLYQRGTNVYVPNQVLYPPNAPQATYSLEEGGISRGTGPYISENMAQNCYWEPRTRLMRPRRFSPDNAPAFVPDNVAPPKSPPEKKQLVEFHSNTTLNVNSRSFELTNEDFPVLTSSIQNIGSSAASKSAKLIQKTGSSAESAQLIQNTGSSAAGEPAQLTEQNKVLKGFSSSARNIAFGTVRLSRSLMELSSATKDEKTESGVSSSQGPILVVDGMTMKGKEIFPESTEKMD